MTYKKACELLKEEMEYAVKHDWILNPMAWALYRVWCLADSEGKEQNAAD